jgi:hypothetical protein
MQHDSRRPDVSADRVAKDLDPWGSADLDILDLFAEDSWRNVYAVELDVRPPAAPQREAIDGQRGRLATQGWWLVVARSSLLSTCSQSPFASSNRFARFPG